MDKLLCTWLHGPDWLGDSEDRWPLQPPEPSSNDDRVICEMTAVHVAISSATSTSILDIDSHSRIEKLLRVTARIFRIIKHCRFKNRAHTGLAEEITETEKYWIRHVQHQPFSEDASLISTGTSAKATSRIKDLNPFLDADSILRVGRRLLHLDASQEVKHPVILPHDHHFSTLLTMRLHCEILHEA